MAISADGLAIKPAHPLTRSIWRWLAGLQEPAVRKRFEGLGATPRGTAPEKFAEIIAADTEKFAAAIKSSGAKAE